MDSRKLKYRVIFSWESHASRSELCQSNARRVEEIVVVVIEENDAVHVWTRMRAQMRTQRTAPKTKETRYLNIEQTKRSGRLTANSKEITCHDSECWIDR